jgi:hypothetical protein
MAAKAFCDAGSPRRDLRFPVVCAMAVRIIGTAAVEKSRRPDCQILIAAQFFPLLINCTT